MRMRCIRHHAMVNNVQFRHQATGIKISAVIEYDRP